MTKKKNINWLEASDPTTSEMAELLVYFKKRFQENTCIPASRFGHDEKICKNCGEVVWMFKDSALCPKCKDVLFKI